MTVETINDLDLDSAVDAAINALCKDIQDQLGVTSGDNAGMFFSDDKYAEQIKEVVSSYATHELMLLDGWEQLGDYSNAAD